MREKDFYKYQIKKMINEMKDTDILRFIYIYIQDIIKDDG